MTTGKKEDERDIKDELVILARLTSADGFFDFASAMGISAQLQNMGVNALTERAPGGLMDSPDAFFIKVPVGEHEKAKKLLGEILNK